MRRALPLWSLLCTLPFSVSANAPALYYDPVSGEYITEDQLSSARSSERDLIVSLRVGAIELGDLDLYEKNGQVWVDLVNAVEVLDFPIEVSFDTDERMENVTSLEASGWFINQNTPFTISHSDGTTQLSTPYLQKELSEEDQLYHLGRVYLRAEDLFAGWGIDYELNRSSLLMMITSEQPLPIEAQMRRRNRLHTQHNHRIEPQYPRADVPYRAFGSIFTDIQLSADQNTNNQQRYRMNILGAGDLAYMTGRYALSTRYDPNREEEVINNFRLSLERKSAEPELLGPIQASQVNLGDITPVIIPNLPTAGNDMGARVSNIPYGRLASAEVTNIVGLRQPGWDVELYRNGLFLDSQTIGEDGQYQFLDQPLIVGENIFTLKFYGPQGQQEELQEAYILDQAALTGNQFIYDLSVTKQNSQLYDYIDDRQRVERDEYRYNLHLEKGITPNISLTGDFSSYHFRDGTRHHFVQPGVRLFVHQAIINLQHLQDLDAGSLSHFSISRGLDARLRHRVSYRFSHQTEDFATDSDVTSVNKDTHSFTLQGYFRPEWVSSLNYSLGANYTTRYDNYDLETYRLGLGFSQGRMGLTNTLNYQIRQNEENQRTEYIDGTLQSHFSFYPLFLRANLDYQTQPQSELKRAAASLNWRLWRQLNTQLTTDHDLREDRTQYGISLNWLTDYFTAGLRVNRNDEGLYSGQMTLRFGLGHDPLRGQPVMTSSRMSSRGAVSALVFEDLNNNQQWDPGEPIIEGAEVHAVQQNRRAKTDASGVAFISGLYDTRPTDVELNPDSLADPFWIPSQQGFSFLPRPGLVKTVFIPVVTGGEIEGEVTFARDLFDEGREQGRVPMQLRHRDQDKIEQKTESVFDGLFLFEKVPPGQYYLEVQPEFLAARNLAARPPMSVEIGADGTLILGANFEIFPADRYDYQVEPINTDEMYALDLGSFISEQNAKLALSALRGVFPEVLSGLHATHPYQVLLTQESDQRYHLKLGPIFDLNHAKFICGSMVQNNLHCQVERLEPEAQAETSAPIEQAPVEQTRQKSATPEKAPASTVAAPPAPPASPKPSVVSHQNLETASILKQPGHYFTLQLMSVENPAALENLRKDHPLLQNARIVPQTGHDELRYVMLLGSFEQRELAQKTAQDIEQTLNIQPWIRPISQISAHIPQRPQTDFEWLSSQPIDHYTIQLGSFSNRQGAMQQKHSLNIEHSRIIPQIQDGELRYVLIHGSFTSREQADQAQHNLNLPATTGWIRPIRTLLAQW